MRKLFKQGLIGSLAGLLIGVATLVIAQTVPFFTVPQATNSQFSANTRPAPGYVNAVVLAANVAQSSTVPPLAKQILFSSTCNFYANPRGTAAVPGSTTTDGSASELNPAAWYNLGASTLTVSLISGSSCVVTLNYYK